VRAGPRTPPETPALPRKSHPKLKKLSTRKGTVRSTPYRLGMEPVDFTEPRPPADGTEAFLVKLAELLHTYGTAADRLEEAMVGCARVLRVRAQFLAGATSIFVAFGDGPDQRTYLVRVDPGEVDLCKLGQLFDVRAQVEDGMLDVVEGARRLKQIDSAGPPYSPLASITSFGLASACAARFFGFGWRESATSFVLGMSIGLLSRVLVRRKNASRLFEPVAAFWAALASLAIARLMPLSASVVTLSSLIVLIPGLTLTIAVSELATRHLVSGTARLAGAMTVFLTIAVGVALGREASGLLNSSPIPEALEAIDAIPPEWTLWLAVSLTPVAFTLLLRARLSQLLWIEVTGVAGFLVSRVGTEHFGPQLGVFLGALTVGLAANLYSRVLRRPGAVLRVPGILLLVPGSIGYQSLAFFLVQDVASGMEAAFRTAIVAVALVGGLLTANVFLRAGRTL